MLLKHPLKLSEIWKRLSLALDDVTKSSSTGMEGAHLHLKCLETELRYGSATDQQRKILNLVLNAKKALGARRIEDTKLLLVAAMTIAEKGESGVEGESQFRD